MGGAGGLKPPAKARRERARVSALYCVRAKRSTQLLSSPSAFRRNALSVLAQYNLSVALALVLFKEHARAQQI